MTGCIFNIQRYSIHDGPGIRTSVFFKGCNQHCWWCHNPEGLHMRPELRIFPEKCIGCGTCFRVCQNKCHSTESGKRSFSREQCRSCGACADACPSQALVLCGKTYEVDDLISEIVKDKEFYGNDGGVTFTGGECMLQIAFLEEALKRCSLRGIHTAIETAANVPYESFERIFPYLDLAIIDIKCITEQTHKDNVGTSNRLILENIERILESGMTRVWIRVPIIPEFNLNREECAKIADYISSLKGVERVELMKYHPLGKGKLSSLGADPGRQVAITDEEYSEAVSIFKNRGIAVIS